MESRQRKVTRKDVAEEAGVSETIVSYVLNKNRYVKEEKRQRVLEAVEKLQYQPNNIARALHGKGSLQILFIAEELSSGYFSEMVSQMSRDAYRQGYMISLCESQKEDEFVSHILSRQFDGLFVSASGVTDSQLKLLVKSGIPMVLFLNREINCELQDTVLVDTGLYEGSRECVRHLSKNGCRNFIYLDKLGKPCDRDIHLKGFLNQVKDLGIVFAPEQKISGCENIKELEEKLRSLLEKNSSIDAVVARYDELAAVALSVARKMGKKVPDDLSVIGFDNDFISNYVSPTLTTVEIQKEEVGRAAMEALLALIRNEKLDKEISFAARLIIRVILVQTPTVHILLLTILVNISVTIPPICTLVFTFTQNPISIVSSFFTHRNLSFQNKESQTCSFILSQIRLSV